MDRRKQMMVLAIIFLLIFVALAGLFYMNSGMIVERPIGIIGGNLDPIEVSPKNHSLLFRINVTHSTIDEYQKNISYVKIDGVSLSDSNNSVSALVPPSNYSFRYLHPNHDQKVNTGDELIIWLDSDYWQKERYSSVRVTMHLAGTVSSFTGTIEL